MGFLDALKSAFAPPKRTVMEHKPADQASPVQKEDSAGLGFSVTGLNYHEEEVLALATKNQLYPLNKTELKKALSNDFCDSVYEYTFPTDLRVSLVPEDDNPHDPKAVKVIMNDQHIGYIKSGSCARVRNILPKATRIEGKISGGNRKDIQVDYPDIDVEKVSGHFTARVTIFVE